MTVTKADFISMTQEKMGVSRGQASGHIEALLDLIKQTLKSGENVKISGFGAFEVKQKNDRRGRNPQTGEEITIGARKVLTFKVSNVLRDALNRE